MGQQVERDGEHMWLRQSVTFSVDGQSRTLEIGIPLRAGATPDEIEALLAEADAGMEHIGRHLETRVARLGGAATSSVPTAAATGAPTHSERPATSEPSEALELGTPAVAPAPAAVRQAEAPSTVAAAASAAASTPTAPSHSTSTPTAARTLVERPAAASPAAASAPATPAVAAAPERTPPAPPAPERPTPQSPASTAAPMTLPEFIAAVQAEQGLNPKQAMERLGVKSLAGLNLREALEMLRRQALREGTGPATPEATPAPTPAPAPAPAESAAPAAPPRYFEEEDDEADIIFTEEEGDELGTEAEMAGYGAGPAGEDDGEYEELDEVPDFGSPPAEPETPAPVLAAPTAAAGATSAPKKEPAPETSRTARILTHMRGMRGGGVPSAHQRTAFKNIVVAELGEPKAKALIAAIWRITPEKLGPEQLDALNNWGKRETFAEDTELVLAAVKAEREHEHEREQGSAGTEAAEEQSATQSRGSDRAAPSRTTSRRTSRATPTGGA